jgi:hypothetical protein
MRGKLPGLSAKRQSVPGARVSSRDEPNKGSLMVGSGVSVADLFLVLVVVAVAMVAEGLSGSIVPGK